MTQEKKDEDQFSAGALLKRVQEQTLPFLHHPLLPAAARAAIGDMVLVLTDLTRRIEKLEKERQQ